MASIGSTDFDDHFLTCSVCSRLCTLHVGNATIQSRLHAVGLGVPCQVCEGNSEGVRSWCVQCAVHLCDSCTDKHTACPNMAGHQIVTQQNLQTSRGVPSSFQRTEAVFEYPTLDGVAGGANRNAVDPVFEREKQYLQGLFGEVEPRAREVEIALNDVEMELLKLPKSTSAAIEQATAYFDHFIAFLQNRKGEVVKEIHSLHQEVGNSLLVKKEAMKSELAGLMSAADFCKQGTFELGVWDFGSGAHVGGVNDQARLKVEELLRTPTDLTSLPSKVMFLKTTTTEKFRDDMGRAGCVHAQLRAKVDASKCTVEVKSAVAEFSIVSLLTTVDESGSPCDVPERNITATLKDPSGKAVPTHLQKKGEGLWEISYTPMVTGTNRLHVDVNGRSVTGSPFDVTVQSSHTPVFTFGAGRTVEQELPHPTDVAVDMQGNIAVVEEGTKRIQIYDIKTSRSLQCFPVDVDGWPCSIDIDSNGHFIVTSDGQNQAIRVYSQQGELLKTMEANHVQSPFGVAVLKDGRMVVADNMSRSCLLLHPDGSLIREIGKGLLRYPWFIAVDESRDLFYVTDHSAHKVFAFNLKGKQMFSFGKKGQNAGEFKSPSGIALDQAGNIIVVSRVDGRLQVFGPNGRYLRTVAKVRGGYPLGIALTEDNYIAVASGWGHCVELYSHK